MIENPMPTGLFRLLRSFEYLLIAVVALFVLGAIVLIVLRIYAHIRVIRIYLKARNPAQHFYVRASAKFTLKPSGTVSKDFNPYAAPQSRNEPPERYLESRTQETLAMGFARHGDYQIIAVIKDKDSGAWKQVPEPGSIIRSFLSPSGTMALTITAGEAETVVKKATTIRSEFSDGRSHVSILPSSSFPLFDVSGLSDVAIAPTDSIEDLIEFHQNLVMNYPSQVIDLKDKDFLENLNDRMTRTVAVLESKGVVKVEDAEVKIIRFTFRGANLMATNYLQAAVAMKNANNASHQPLQPKIEAYDPRVHRRLLILGALFLSSFAVIESYAVLFSGLALFMLGVFGYLFRQRVAKPIVVVDENKPVVQGDQKKTIGWKNPEPPG